MNRSAYLILLVFVAMVLAACQSAGQPTESSPETVPVVSVQGYELELASASLSKEYYSAGYAMTAGVNENLLIVKIKVLPGDDTVDILSWSVTLDTDDSRGIKPAGSEVQSYDDRETDELTWIFTVPDTTATYVLNFPDSSMINLSSAVASLVQ
jgi:hypothetical protein